MKDPPPWRYLHLPHPSFQLGWESEWKLVPARVLSGHQPPAPNWSSATPSMAKQDLVSPPSLADRSLRCRVLQAPVSAVSWLMPDLLSPFMCFFTPTYPRTSRRAPADSPQWYASLYAKSSATAVLWVTNGCLVEAHMRGSPPWVIMIPCMVQSLLPPSPPTYQRDRCFCIGASLQPSHEDTSIIAVQFPRCSLVSCGEVETSPPRSATH